MGKNKLLRFKANAERRNVIEPGKEIFHSIKGKWKAFFGNTNPITLELCCGNGEYTTGLAAIFPEKNFIGVDIKGARIWKGSSIAIEKNLTNVAFLRVRMYELEKYFESNEVNEIWMVCPDPRMRDRDEKHRLTNHFYLKKYFDILAPNGVFRLKTDSESLFDYTIKSIRTSGYVIDNMETTKDLYNSPLLAEHYGIETKYEKIFRAMGCKINYMQFVLKK